MNRGDRLVRLGFYATLVLVIWGGVWLIFVAVIALTTGSTSLACSAGSFWAFEAELLLIFAAPCLVAAALGRRLLLRRGATVGWRQAVPGVLITAIPPFAILSLSPLRCV